MSHVSWGDSAFPPVSEASGYGNKVLFTPAPASQGWCRRPAPTRLQLQTTLETNPEDRAPLGWEIEFESVCCSYQASTGSDGIELRHDQLRIMSPLKSKQFERSSHVHPASVAQESQTGNFAEVLILHLSRTRGCSRKTPTTTTSKSPRANCSLAVGAMTGKGKGSGLTRKQKAPAAAKKAVRARVVAQKAPASRPARQKRGAQPKRKVCIPNYLDPLCAIPAPSVTSDGKALPHTGLTSGDFVVGSTDTTLLFITNTGSSGTVGMLFNVSPTGTYTDGLQVFTIPTLAAADTAGGPSAARAMKFSVSVTNCTNALNRGGRVTYLNSSQRLPPVLGGLGSSWVDDYSHIIGGIKDSPYRRRVTGDCLGVLPGGKTTQLIGYPVDSVNYSKFRPFHGTLTFTEFRNYVMGASIDSSGVKIVDPSERSMSIVAYIFDPVSVSQDYSVTIRASYYTRWPLTSVPGQSMRNMPTADASVVNHARDHAEATANDLAHVVEGGALATFGPKIAGAARAGMSRLGGMFGRVGVGAVETVEGAATEMLGAEGAALLGESLPILLAA